jgi:integrase
MLKSADSDSSFVGLHVRLPRWRLLDYGHVKLLRRAARNGAHEYLSPYPADPTRSTRASCPARASTINTVSRMLGHSSTKVTLDVYCHVMPGMQDETLGHINGVFS